MTARIAIDTMLGNELSDMPCQHFEAVTPSDSDELVHVARKLYIGGAGNISVVGRGDTAAVVIAVTAGQILEGFFRKVTAAGTTATGIVAGH